MRKVFGFLTMFDWISPMVGVAQDLANDPTGLNSWTFFLPYDEVVSAGWDAGQMQRLLNENGLKHWGHQYNFVDLFGHSDEWFFTVPLDQAPKIERLLQKHGIPIAERSRGAPGGQPLEVTSFDSVQSDSGGFRLELWGYGLMLLALALVCRGVG